MPHIVDYGSGGDNLTAGLNGIREKNTQYDTLFDFYRDTAQVAKLDKACTYDTRSRQPNAATSPIFMADGRIGYVAIYPRYSATTDSKGIKTTVYDNYFFDESYNGTYSSPIDYKSEAQKENFREKFELVFDDYNSDGSADFALKRSAEDENADGATYEVRCMSNDLTPRAERFSFFMAGRHEESIRLQHTDNGGYVYWSKGEDGKLKANVTVDDYRMYSERYYLPADLRFYDDEKTVYCFFWNNTAKDVKVGGKYHVEYNKNGKWVSVTDRESILRYGAEIRYFRHKAAQRRRVSHRYESERKDRLRRILPRKQECVHICQCRRKNCSEGNRLSRSYSKEHRHRARALIGRIYCKRQQENRRCIRSRQPYTCRRRKTYHCVA